MKIVNLVREDGGVDKEAVDSLGATIRICIDVSDELATKNSLMAQILEHVVPSVHAFVESDFIYDVDYLTLLCTGSATTSDQCEWAASFDKLYERDWQGYLPWHGQKSIEKYKFSARGKTAGEAVANAAIRLLDFLESVA